MFAEKFHLRIPGPTPIPPRVQQAMAHPMIGHRSGQASQLIQECIQHLQPVFGTKQSPLLISGSGTSALEAAVINSVSVDEEAIVVVTGAFGDRFAKILQRYGITCHRLEIPWGKACDPDTLATFVQKHPQSRAVFMTYCETSTGVLNPIAELAKVIHQHSDALTIVDAVSCLGAVPTKMDEWGIDLIVSGSQKAMMLPPGLAFVACSERAWSVIEKNNNPRFYLDLPAYKKNMEKDTTPYTPAVSLLFGLRESLHMLEEEGLDHVYHRHEQLKQMTRAGIEALGLELMTSDVDASPTVTSIWGGKGKWDSEELRKQLRQLQVIVAGGQQHLKGQIFRIGHMGYCDPLDILTVFNTLELSLAKIGVSIPLGQGVKAAQEVMLRHV
ncbi:pyridoxal-phosphate-dependent aminotransferase family protein [Hazenella coriacea]|uniref:pyridoxal-phosphate-dependent aminotransferase family protein n=1 Tax=Hazenella coriacea TaxID=1179467 RepID=UPI0010522D80|nr:alanine--glyoxylate aminotransferase family protein [Hazenella coriacea]